MRAAHPVTRRALLKLSLAAAGSAATTALLAACGGEAATAPPTAPATRATGTNAPAATTAATVAPATTATTPTVATPTGAAIPARSGAKTTIEFYHIALGTNGATLREVANRFNDTNTGITVKEQVYPSFNDLLTAVQAAGAAKMFPAVAWIGYDSLNYAANGIPHTTIDDVAKRDPQSGDFLKNFAPNVLALGKVGATLHGMPFGISSPMLYVNNDLLKQAGFEKPPATWDEVRTYARQITDKAKNTGFAVAETSGFWSYQGVVETNGARLLAADANPPHTGVDSPEMAEAMQFIAEMVLREKSAAFLSIDQAQQGFVAGQLGMMISTSARLVAIVGGSKFAVGTARFPTFGAKPRRVPGGSGNLFIFATEPERQAAAWEFIKYMNSAESFTAFTKGTGILPTRTGVAEDPAQLKPFFESNPLTQASLTQVPDVVPWVSWPGKNGIQAQKTLEDARARILTGSGDAVSVLRDAAKEINGYIMSR